ncbi:MAG TPA: 30S ribosomal protein S6 [Longimicrobiales bacterium]|nr:30S ribosomal protein S6 [Longimicrobiales bacterium]
MKPYEVVYIFDSALPEDRINEKLERFHAQLISEGGEVTATDHWGRRQMTYPIKKKQAGYYVVAQFQSPGASLPEFERLLKLDEELLRYLVVAHEGEPTAPMSIATREPRRDDEEGEGEGEDDE